MHQIQLALNKFEIINLKVKSEFMQLIDIINNQNSPILIYLNKFDTFDTFEQDIDLEYLEENLEVDTII